MIKNLFFLVVFILGINMAQATIYYVNINSSTNGNGLTVATPSKDLFLILQQTIGKDEVRIATGIYETPASGSSFDIYDKYQSQAAGPELGKILISGGWNAAFTEQNPSIYPTILKRKTGSTNAILYVQRTHLELNGITFQDADKTNGSLGGAIQNYTMDGSFVMTVRNCIFKNNKNSVQGGAIGVWSRDYNWYSAQNYFYNCTFDGNRSANWGGACVFYGVDAKFWNCTFVNNYAGEHGGALHQSSGGGIYLNSCTIVGNTAGNGCGGFAPWTNGFVVNSIIAGNKTINNANSGIHDVNQQVTDQGNNIFGCYASLPRTLNATTRYVTIDALNSILESTSPTVYPDHLFSAKLADNGGFTPTVKLLSTSINTYATNTSSGWATTKLDNKTGGLATDQRGIARAAGNTCIGAFEYKDVEFTPPAFTAVWSPDRGAVTLDIDFYKYKKDVRFIHDMYISAMVVDYSLDGINFTPLLFVRSNKQDGKERGQLFKSFSFQSCYGARFEIRNRSTATDGWLTVNDQTITPAYEYSTSETFSTRIHWQIPTEMVGKKIYLKYRIPWSNTPVIYEQEIISPTGTPGTIIGYSKTYPINSIEQVLNVTAALPAITTAGQWQNDGSLNYTITAPTSVPASAQYMVKVNGIDTVKKDNFSTKVQNFAYSTADLSKVKKYVLTSTYSPNPAFSGFPTFNITSNETIVKAYSLPEKLNVSYDGCVQKNTISFTVPAVADAANSETANYELCRAEDSSFVSGFKVIASSNALYAAPLSAIAYSPTKTDYSVTDPEAFGASVKKTFFYKLRRVPLIAAWDWATHVRIGSVDFNSNHKQIKDITVSIVNGKPYIKWNYSTDGVFCSTSSITISRNGTVIPGAQFNQSTLNLNIITDYTDASSLTACTPLTYSISIGSNAHSYTTVASSNSVLVPLALDQQPVLQYIKASKGYYNDRVELEWNLKQGTLSSFLIRRKLYEETGDKFVTIGEISVSASKLYKYLDVSAVPSRYYTYQVVAVTNCAGTPTETPLLSDLGFRMPTGSVGGRIVYTGDVPVDGANIIIQGADQMKNRSVTLGSGSILIPDKSNLLNPAAFSIQAWLKLAANAGTDTLMNKGSQFILLKVGTKLQIKVGAVTKDITGFVVPVNTYFHVSIVENSTSTFIVYINAKAVCTLTGFVSVKNANSIVIKSSVLGYLDELRIWNKLLTANEIATNYDRYISGKETGLVGYYRLDEKINEYIFDMSSQELVYNENHGNITGNCARSEYEVPSSEQLSLKGKTDVNGNYLVGGIPYFADGTSYTFTPQLGTHEFNPKQRPLFLGDKSAVQNNVDFTDVSSFKFEGVVVYSGGTYPVEGVSFLIDGKPALDAKGLYLVTDAEGKYSLSVPIGEHTLEATKQGHVFSRGKFTTNFQKNYLFPSGFTFEDGTRIKLIGRVVGGKIESEKGLLIGQSKNNIGQAIIVLEPLKKDKYDMRVTGKTLVDTVIKHDDGSLTRPSSASNSFSMLQKQVTIKTSPLTGEFVAYVYPEDYKVLQTKTTKEDILGGTTSGLFLKSLVNDLYEVTKWTDTILVPAKGSQLAYKKTVEKIDSVLYHAKYVQTLIVDPEFSITELDSLGKPKAYLGDTIFVINDVINKTNMKVKLVTLANNIPTYAFGVPVYQQSHVYSFLINAFEKYVNADNLAESKVPVKSGSVLIANTMKVENQNTPESIALDSLGSGIYSFMGGAPDLTTGLKKVDAYLQRDNRIFPWNSPFTAYLLGGRSNGSNFTTSGPNKVIHILRDPPGTLSYSYLEKGASIFNNSTSAKKQMLDFEASLTHKFGFKGASFVGIGAGVILEASSKFDLSVGMHLQQNYSSTEDSTDVVTTTQRFETSADPLWVGADADVFIGYASNILYGTTSSINIVKKADLAASTVTKILKNIGDYALVQGTGIAMGQTFATEFAYTTRDLEQIFIPGWKKIRNKFILPKGYPVDVSKIKNPVYVSLVDPDHKGYGANNSNKEIWGNAASDVIGDGPSYKIYLPAGEKYFTGTDSIVWCNNQIKFWIRELAKNEQQKLEASLIKNQSFTSGAKYEYSVQTETGKLTTDDWDVMISGKIGLETGVNITGMGFDLSINTEIGGGNAGSTTTGTQRTKTVGFVLQETGDFDAITVDYKNTQDGSISFNTRGGQTSCPHEGAVYTKYYKPETILSEATMQIEKPVISVLQPVMNNVPSNRNAVFELSLKNESAVKGDIYYVLSLDGTTNPNGAILKVDGAVIDEGGRSFLVRSDQVLKKTLTITKGPNALDYENIRIFLSSACQSDPTDFTPDIYDEVLVSAYFIPNCSEISLTSPLNNWVMNTTTGDTLAVKLENYDVNYANFGYIALQVKNSSVSTWSEEMKFYANSTLFSAATGSKSMIDLKKNDISYKMKLPYADNTFDVRAVAYCVDPVSKTVLAQTPTVIASGIKDMVRPVLFGLTQPSDGILKTGDEIQVQFNEDIAEGLLTHNNFSVTGIKNGTNTIHTVAVNFDGVASSLTTEQTLNLSNKSFTMECWLKRNALGKGTIISHGSANGFEFGFDINNKLYVKNGSTILTSASAYTDITTWNHYAVVYDLATLKISVYVNGDFSISDVPFGAYSETGILRMGVNAASANYLSADIHEFRVWETAIDRGTIASNRSTTFTGIEQGMIGYWPMNEGKGKIAFDKSRGRNANLVAIWTLNPAGKSVSLTGTASSVTLNTAQMPISASSDYSIEFWFKGAAQTNACLFSAGRGDGEEFGVSRNNAAIWFNETGLLSFANNAKKVQLSTVNYLDNQWHHFAVSIGRLSTANFYVDGVLISSVDARGFTTITATSMYLGMRKYMSKITYGTFLSDMYFKGQVDEFRMWNTSLSATLLNKNSNTRLQGNETGLAAYYPFDAYQNNLLTYTLNNQVVKSKEIAILAGGVSSLDYAPIKIGNVPENLGFEFVSNKDKINIKLTEQNSVIERSSITIAVSDIQDKNGNLLASPISWDVYVDRSQMKWDNNSLVFNKAVNTELTYTTRILNTGATTQKFEITNIPTWMTVEPSSGTVKAQASQEITFTVDKGLNIGAYDENLYLRSDYNEPLSLRVNVLSEIPDWKVDAGKFSSSMNIVASLKISDLVSTDKNDKVAVFLNGECTGIAQPVFYKELNKYLLYIKVFGNELMQNSKLVFKVFDASSGKIFSAKPATPIYFSDNGLYGDPIDPLILTAKDEIYQIIPLNLGWSWVSFQVASADLLTVQGALSGMIAKSGDVIKNNALGVFDAYSEGNRSWAGTLTTGGGIKNNSMYFLKSSVAQPLSIAGTLIDPTLLKIPVKGTKWNYVGYVPARNIPIKEALAGYVATAKDVIKSQDAFSIYDVSLGWIGDLKYLEPGKGYMIYRTGATDVEFTYPKNIISKKGGTVVNARLVAGRHSETMNVIATVASDFGFTENDWILGYNGDEMVSATQMSDVKLKGESLVFANIHSENATNIRFVLERENKEIAQANESLVFSGNSLVGSLTSPMMLNFKAINETINISAYPNPVENELKVQINTIGNQSIEVSVCDLLGKTLIQTINKTAVDNFAETSVNMASLKSGIYLVKVKVDGQIFVKKITKN